MIELEIGLGLESEKRIRGLICIQDTLSSRARKGILHTRF